MASTNNGGGSVILVCDPVTDDLGDYVARIEAFDLTVPEASIHFGVPSSTLTVLVSIDEPFDIGWAGSDGSSFFPVLVAGLHTTPSLVRTHGIQRGIQLALTPLGCRALFGMPCGELARELVNADMLGDDEFVALHSRIAETPSWESRLAMLRGFLRGRVAKNVSHSSLGEGLGLAGSAAAEAWWLLHRARGNARVSELASSVGVSRRTLLAGFRGEFGVGPKEEAQVLRFCHARDLVESGTSLVDAAAASGYADQAHMSREWARIAGLPPSLSVGNPFPILQDLREGARAY